MNLENARKIMAVLKERVKENVDGIPLNDLRMIAAFERVIARIATNKDLDNCLIFKGGFVLLKTIQSSRFTRDIDALAKDIAPKQLINAITVALQRDLNDGLWFGDIKTSDLGKDMPYPGIRFDVAFQIGAPPEDENKIKKLSRIHFDVGFGDSVLTFHRGTMPSILPQSYPIEWSTYPLEQIMAEKIHALVVREAANSRAKDVYDLVIIFRRKDIDRRKLVDQISSTFKARKTDLPVPLVRDIKTMDLTILKSAWRSVEIMGARGEFDKFWEELLDYLSEL